jgi:hypothetical protein
LLDLLPARLGVGPRCRPLPLGPLTLGFQLGAGPADLLLGPLEHLPGFVLGHPQHGPHPLTHTRHALRRPHQAADLRPQLFRMGPGVIEFACELCGLAQGGLPIGDQNLDLRVQPPQMVVHLPWVIAPADHLEGSA